jgi:hexosaminidase
MLDSSRHFQPPATIRKILDLMSLLKLNVLHWHLTDDQAWRVQIDRYPKLAKLSMLRDADEPGGPGYYTKADIREIVRYASARHITIVPEIEIPAHTAAAMVAYPELTCAGKPTPIVGFGIHKYIATGTPIYCAGKEQSFEFIRDMLDEVMAMFPSPVIHLGGDERPDGIWSACPRCQAVMAREGLKSETELQHWFMNRVTEYVNSKGRRTMAWTPTVQYGVPKDQIVEDWLYGVLPEAVAAGSEVVSARDRFTYFDYPNFPGRQKPDWMPDLDLQTAYQFEPIPDGLTPENERRVLGAECSLWTEFIEDEDLSGALFPRMLAFAETMWSPKASRDWPGFQARLQELEPYLASKGVRYARPELPTSRLAGHVETTMKADGPYLPECAFDGKFVRFFWSAQPPKSGDHITLWLAEPMLVSSIRVYTGSDIVPDRVLPDGFLEVSEDGDTFRAVARVNGPFASADFVPRTVRAVRLTVSTDMSQRLAVREIVIGTPQHRVWAD